MRQQHDGLRREERDGEERLGRHVAGEQADGADLEEARGGRVDGHDQRQAEPAADEVGGSADRPREQRKGDARLEVVRDRGRPEERRGHREDEAEHERGEDQDLRHRDPDLELVRALRRGPARRGRRCPSW